MKVTQHEAVEALRALGFGVVPDEHSNRMLVTVPTYRSDIVEGVDLVEEVVRMIGYDKILKHHSSWPIAGAAGTIPGSTASTKYAPCLLEQV